MDSKVSIYLDFWNFSLSLRDHEPYFRTDWFAISNVFIEQAQKVLSDGSVLKLQDFNIFGSYTKTPADTKLYSWATTFLPKVRGAKVRFDERKPKKSGPICPGCHEEISVCPKCSSSMIGTEEKCIDTLIATTMLQDGWLKKIDVAIIVSADKDFIPAVDFLSNNGIKTIHAQFGNWGAELTKACWGRFNILSILDQIEKTY